MSHFVVLGAGEVHELGPTHLDGWNSIAADPTSRRELYLPEFTVMSLAGVLADAPEDWRVALRNGDPYRKELVLVDDAGTVTSAIQLAFYSCDDAGDWSGALMKLAVARDRRGGGVGTAVVSELSRWLTCEVPGAHVFGDVCTENVASTRMFDKALWSSTRPVRCTVWDSGNHRCAERAIRYCAHPGHG